MKTKYILILTSLIFSLFSCEMKDEIWGNTDSENEGIAQLALASEGNVSTVIVKGNYPDTDVDLTTYTIKIVNATTETVVKESSYSDLMDEGGNVKLTAGNYYILAYNYDGSSVGASERAYFLGKTEFQILAGKTTVVNTVCKSQTPKVALVLTDDFKTTFKDDYTITITNGANGSYVFNKTNITKNIFYSIPQDANSLFMTVKATTNSGVDIIQTYTITKPSNAEGGAAPLDGKDFFKIYIDPSDSPTIEVPSNNVELDIRVDLSTNDSEEIIEIPTGNITYNPSNPSIPTQPEGPENKGPITVTGLNVTYEVSASDDSDVPTVVVNLDVPNGIDKLLVKINSNDATFMGLLADPSLNLADEFDLADPGDRSVVLGELNLINPEDNIKGKTTYTFDITGFVPMLKLFSNSNNSFTMTVSDGVNEDVVGVLNINVVE